MRDGELNPVIFVATHNKVLLYRARDICSKDKNNPSHATPECYLLDAGTGGTELVRGEFQPLIQQAYRGLQPAGRPDGICAAVYSRKKNETDVGLYDAKNFSFRPVLKLPDILHDSTEIWVDEKENKVISSMTATAATRRIY
jgi:hypothetical protein